MLVFCVNCGKEVKDDENFCPHCGKPLRSTTEGVSQSSARPAGITILAILQIIAGIICLIAAIVIGAFSGIIGNMMYENMMKENMMPGMGPGFFGAIGGALAVFLGILGAISIFVAWAMFSAKRWARTVVIILSIIDIVFSFASIVSGNASGVASIILNAIVLYYMWRPHVIAYFNK